MSTQTKWKADTDILLFPSKENGIKKESLVRLSKFATIDKDLVIGRLGTIEDKTIRLVNQNLKKILNIDE
ncbi:type II toxin-antitoxin system PemK/MazF family toxin [Sinomicrobium weinanense]|uniref:type II toxin-antitoxin system PemK/MazF family toxin n=1 Tax=Sinomicrobium weinanense TaxID=2842200 RepID=UPI001C0E58BF|nr:type II toxin-antitoxin system PemK/MazF family toxin [Sinomicrobium weinanense]